MAKEIVIPSVQVRRCLFWLNQMKPDTVSENNKGKHWRGRTMQVKEQCLTNMFYSFLHIPVAILYSLNIPSVNNTLTGNTLMVYYNKKLILYSLFIPIISGN